MPRGWFRDSKRHAQAARGIKTTPGIRRALAANKKMDGLVSWIDRKLAWGSFADFSVEDRNYFIQELGDIMTDLENVELPTGSTRILKDAGSEVDRLLGMEHVASQLLRLETVRERLHVISTCYLRERGHDVGHVDEIEW